MKVGVDVGGTNTDAVIVGPKGVVGWQKTPTTEDVYSGIVTAISAAIDDGGVDKGKVDSVMIGTTQFTNAVIERRALLPVGVLRLCLPATSAIPPMTDWPRDLARVIGGHVTLVAGGYEYDGREISPLDEIAIAEAARAMRQEGLQSAAVTSVFSPMNGAMERRAAEIIRNEAPDIAVSLSSELGQFGLLPRENSTIINASLVALAARVVEAFRRALHELGLDVPLFISQNDGTLMRVEEVERYPVLTFASGPTNSMRGAAHLAGIGDAMVVDIGGTTSDIGMLRKGFPRQSTHFVDVGDVKTNFRMPDVLAIGLGGGSIVRDRRSTRRPRFRRLRTDPRCALFRRRHAHRHRRRGVRRLGRNRRPLPRERRLCGHHRQSPGRDAPSAGRQCRAYEDRGARSAASRRRRRGGSDRLAGSLGIGGDPARLFRRRQRGRRCHRAGLGACRAGGRHHREQSGRCA